MGQPGFWRGDIGVLKWRGEKTPPEAAELARVLGALSPLDWLEVLRATQPRGLPSLRSGGSHWYLILPTPCQARCAFCSSALSDRVRDFASHWKEHPSMAEYLKFLVRFSNLPEGAPILVGGNEPLVSANLELFFKTLQEEGHPLAGMSTLGWPLEQGQPARLKQLGLEQVEIPLYGADPATHDQVVRHAGGFRKAREAIAAFKEAGVKVHVHTVLLRNNLDSFGRLVDLVASMEIPRLTVHMPRSLREAPWKDWDLQPSLREIKTTLNVLPNASKVTLDLKLPPCSLPESMRGSYSRPEPSARDAAGDLLPLEFLAPCKSCSMKPVCPGVSATRSEIWGEWDLEPITEEVKPFPYLGMNLLMAGIWFQDLCLFG